MKRCGTGNATPGQPRVEMSLLAQLLLDNRTLFAVDEVQEIFWKVFKASLGAISHHLFMSLALIFTY